ncbi:glyoxalase/bleomycin resistance protein/dioxygenase [Hyaloraphidium curvatum]|nr:glyoxalase/bleomycin resistance protein/dioxygenase [Hyaloraphidium curvatum]
MVKIGYVCIGTNDLAKALAFYDEVLGPLGQKAVIDLGRGKIYGGADGLTLFVTQPYDKNDAHPGNGPMPALSIDSRKGVDEAHARALKAGGKDEGAPGLRGPEGDQAFYGAYFRDLDGNKICIFKMGPADA